MMEMINENLQERLGLSRERQLQVLKADRDYPEWEKAHVTLFILHEAEKNGWGTRWCIALRSAHDALRSKNSPRFDALLDRMERMLAGKTDNEKSDEED